MKSGLERVAEELMGRRKWKHYQDVLTHQQLNLLDSSATNNTTTTTTTTTTVAVDAVDDELLQQAVAGSVASNAIPLTPSLVAAAVAASGNLLQGEKGGGGATIVRNGHYQQDGGELLESKLANSQQVAADKLHPEFAATTTTTTTTTATPTNTTSSSTNKQNHFHEHDSPATTPATAGSNPPPPPPPPPPQTSSLAAALVGTLVNNNNNNNHHHHHPHQLHHLPPPPYQAKKEHPNRPEGAAAEAQRTVIAGSSPTRTTSSSSSPPGSTGAKFDTQQQELAVKLAIKQEPAENQNNSSATPEQSKLIKRESCNTLLNNKIIINNNNSNTATNNNNNNISSGNDVDGAGRSPNGSTGVVATATAGASGNKDPSKPSPPPTPVDWKPQDKCYFCVDGKLLTVNEAGELVPESGPPGLGGVPTVGRTKMEVDLVQALNDSDSDSSDSSEADLREVVRRQGAASTKSLAALLRGTGSAGIPPTMTSLQSMFAAAALQGIQPGLAPFYNPLWYSQLQQPMSPSGSPGTAGTTGGPDGASPSEKGGTEGGVTLVGPSGEQPLDLSAKPGTSGGLNAAAAASTLMMSMMDPKHYKAKPRLSPIGGRRTYTEDELQSALQDILNGKLGTRRAAVQYGIPRSTLRNKVYKLAMEHKREMLHNMSLAALVDDDDDKDSVEDCDGKEDSYQLKLNQQAFAEAYLRMYGGSGGSSSTPKPEPSSAPSTPPQQQPTPEPPLLKPIQSQTPHKPVTPQSSSLTAAANATSLIDHNMLLQLQSLLLAGGISAQSKSPEETSAIQTALSVLPELVNKLVQQQELIEQIKKANEQQQQQQQRPSSSTPTLNNGQPIDPRLLPYLQAQHQGKPRTSTGTPETTSSMDLNDGGSDDSQVILKIPSYKPVPGTSPMPATAAALLAASKNGDHQGLSSPSPPTATPTTVRDLSSLVGGPGPSTNSSNSIGSRSVHTASPHQHLHPAVVQREQPQPPQVSNQPPNHLSVISPPMGGIRPRSNSQSPPSLLGGKSMLSINDVIARSISKNFQQHHQSDLLKQQMESMEQQYKRPTISVIKNLGGTDISRFGRDPNITQMTAAQLANTGTGGKGTRPKRGKYRNYDRDSLVEAVKAVQRGEMSVHRAGSYYGVPHSTLEYKVKERHLMRPRKREPKPQPGLDGLKSELSGSSSVMRNMDKSKNMALGAGSKAQQMKNQYPGQSPNGGLKMPMFDPSAMASQLPYTSPFMWPHPSAGFSGLPMDFGRQAGGGGAGASGSGSAGDNIFASPIMQRFQDPQGRDKIPSLNNSSGGTPKTTRELAESIYDGTNTNGSLLDDIIRHSLDKKPGEMSHGALFDQLMKNNSLRTSATAANTDDTSATLLAKAGTKRSATSPLTFLPDTIKRERSSPGASSTSSTSSSKPLGSGVGYGNEHQQHHLQRHLNTSTDGGGSLLEGHRAAELLAQGNLAVESIIKLREGLTSLSAAHHHKRTPMEDQHNGAGPSSSSSSSCPDGRDSQELLQHHHLQQQQQQLLSHRLGTKLPTGDDSS